MFKVRLDQTKINNSESTPLSSNNSSDEEKNLFEFTAKEDNFKDEPDLIFYNAEYIKAKENLKETLNIHEEESNNNSISLYDDFIKTITNEEKKEKILKLAEEKWNSQYDPFNKKLFENINENNYDKALELLDMDIESNVIPLFVALEEDKYQKAISFFVKYDDPWVGLEVAKLDDKHYKKAISFFDKYEDPWVGIELANLDDEHYKKALNIIDKVDDPLNAIKIAKSDAEQYEKALNIIDKIDDSIAIRDIIKLDEKQYERAINLLDNVSNPYDAIQIATLDEEQYKKAQTIINKYNNIQLVFNTLYLDDTEFDIALNLFAKVDKTLPKEELNLSYDYACQIADLDEERQSKALDILEQVNNMQIAYQLSELEDSRIKDCIELYQDGYSYRNIQKLADLDTEKYNQYIDIIRKDKDDNGEYILGVDTISYIETFEPDSEKEKDFNMLLNAVKNGYVDKFVLSRIPISGNISKDVLDDIEKLDFTIEYLKTDEAKEKGLTIEDIFIPTFSSEEDALETQINIGDVFQVEGEDYIRIKTTDEESKLLKITKETYYKLFPPITRFATVQNGIGNCWEITGINSMYSDPYTRDNILELFSEDGDDIYIEFPESKAGKIKFENGELPPGTNEKYYSVGALGINMIEYADGIEIQAEKIKQFKEYIYNSVMNAKNKTQLNKYVNEMQLLTSLVNDGKEIEIYNSRYVEEYNGEFDSVYLDNRDEGFTSNFYKRMGLNTIIANIGNAHEIMCPGYFDSHIVSFGTIPASTEEGKENTLDKDLGIYSSHAYRIYPKETYEDGFVKTFSVINPWGIMETELTFEELSLYADAFFIAEKN